MACFSERVFKKCTGAMLLIQNGRGLLMDNNCRQYGFRGNRSGIVPESATGIRWLKESDLRLGIFAKI